MFKHLDSIDDLFYLQQGDQFSAGNRKTLFTGPQIGNTYQKGINWIGDFPNLDLVIVRSSPKEYGDRWLDENENLYLYYLMIEHRGTNKAKINYDSKENRALLDQHLHNAKVLLTTNSLSDNTLLNVEGYFNVIETRRDDKNNSDYDSVVLERINLEDKTNDSVVLPKIELEDFLYDISPEEMSDEEYINWFLSLTKAEQFEIVFEFEEFSVFCKEIDEKYKTIYDNGRLKTTNTTGKARSAWLSDIYRAISTIYQNYDAFKSAIITHNEYSSKNLDKYIESPFRKGYEAVFSVEEFDEIYGWATEQTPSFTETLTKLISFTLGSETYPKIDKILDFSQDLIKEFLGYPELIGFDEWDLKSFDQVILQPSASRSAQKNFGTTVEAFTDINEITHLISDEEYNLLAEDCQDYLGFWGVRNMPPSTWERIKPGALVLFFANKTAFAACRLGNKVKNQKLAEYFWEGKGNESFKYMYSIVEYTEVHIPQSFINRSIGYKENFVVQGFQVLDNEKSSLLLSNLRELQTGKPNLGSRGSGYETCIGCDRTMIQEEIDKNGFCPTC